MPLALMLCLAGLATVLFTLPWWGRGIAQRVMDGYLVASGLHPARAEIDDWNWSRLSVRDIELDGGDWRLHGERAGVTYSIWPLVRSGRLDQVWAGGILVELDVDAIVASPAATAADEGHFRMPELPMQYARLSDGLLRLNIGTEAVEWQMQGWWGRPGILTLSGTGPFDWLLEGDSNRDMAAGELEFALSELDLAWLYGLVTPHMTDIALPVTRIAGSAPALSGGLRWRAQAPAGWGGVGTLRNLELSGDDFSLTLAEMDFGLQGVAGQPQAVELSAANTAISHSGVTIALSSLAFGGVLEDTLMGRIQGLTGSYSGIAADPWQVELSALEFSVSNPYGSLLTAAPDALAISVTLSSAPVQIGHESFSFDGLAGVEGRLESGPEGMAVDAAIQGEAITVRYEPWQIELGQIDGRAGVRDAIGVANGNYRAKFANVVVSTSAGDLLRTGRLETLDAQVASHGRDLQNMRMDASGIAVDTAYGELGIASLQVETDNPAEWSGLLRGIEFSGLQAPKLGFGSLTMAQAQVQLQTTGREAGSAAEVTIRWHEPVAVAARFQEAGLRFNLSGSMRSAWQLDNMQPGSGSGELHFAHGHGHWGGLGVQRLDGVLSADWDPPAAEDFDGRVQLRLERMDLDWTDGSGELSGLAANINLTGVMSARSDGGQEFSFERLRQGEINFVDGKGTLQLHGGGDTPSGVVEVRASGFGGHAGIHTDFSTPGGALAALLAVSLERVELQQLAALFPAFDGSISGRVSGRLEFAWREGRLILRPGELAMVAGETGHFSFRRTGWLSGDTALDLDTLEQSREVHQILQLPVGAAILTEMALRNLTMEHFRLRILPAASDKPVLIDLTGYGKVRDTRVPVVLTIPVGGDLLETLEMVLALQDRLSAAR